MTAFSINTIFGAVDRFSGPVARMEAANKRFTSSAEKAFGGLGKKIINVREHLIALAANLSIAAIVAMGFNGIKDFETSLTSFSAVSGVTGKSLDRFKTTILNVASDTKKSAVDVAKSFELIGSAKSELLQDEKALGLVSRAAITLSKASRDELENSTTSLVGVLNMFNLKADQSMRVVNALSAGEVVGAARTTQVNESIRAFGAGADMMNVSLEQSISMVEVLSQKQIFGAEAGTKLRNILSKMSAAKGLPKEALDQMHKMGININLVSDKAIPFEKRLTEMAKAVKNPVALMKIFGEENKEAAAILLNNIPLFKDWTKQVTGTDTALKQADTNSKTFTERLDQLKNKFINLMITGNETSGTLNLFGGILEIITDHLGSILGIIGISIGVYGSFWAVMKAGTIIQGLFNVALGVTAAFQKSVPISVGRNTVALNAYKIATGAATKVQWLFNAAASMNPYVWIAIAIIAVIVAVTLMVLKWKELVAWFNNLGPAMKFIIGLLAITQSGIIMLAFVIRKVIDTWKLFSASFDKGFLNGIKTIGKFILSMILAPLQFILKILGQIPGLGKMADFSDKIGEFRSKLEGEKAETNKAAPVNLAATSHSQQNSRYEEIKRQQVDIQLTNKTDKNVSLKRNPARMPITTTTN